MTAEPEKRIGYRPRIWTFIVLMMVAALILVSNLSRGELPAETSPPSEAEYGWPLIWYACEFRQASRAEFPGAARRLNPVIVRWSGPQLAANLALWLAISAGAATVSEWLMRRYSSLLHRRPRIPTLVVLLLVATLIVLANLSGDEIRWLWPKPAYGWPLIWRWRNLQYGYGVIIVLDRNYSAPRLAVNMTIWLVMLAATGAVCEWLLRRYPLQFRWSLKAMLATVAAVGALLAWCIALDNRANLQDPVISLADPESPGDFTLFIKRSGPKWLDLVGADRFRRSVVGADIRLSENLQKTTLKQLARLPDLRYLKMNIWEPTPSLASALSEMRQLKTLRIDCDSSSQDAISEECFAAIGKLTQLEDLHFGDVTDGHRLAQLAGLINLKSLSLRFALDGEDEDESDEPDITEEIPLLAHLPALPRLEVLDIRSWDLMIDEQDIRRLADLPRLKSLNLGNSDVTDEGLAGLASLKSLEELAIDGDTVTAARLKSLLPLKRFKALHLKRYTAVTKDTLEALPAQNSFEARKNAGDSMLQTEWEVLRALQRLKDLRIEQYGSYDNTDRMTTVTLDHGNQIFALESEVDGFRRALEALRGAHPGILIDSNPKWFDQYRGEKRPEQPPYIGP